MTREPLRHLPDSNQRYLRGRLNRRVRKAYRLRAILRVWKVVLANLGAAALLLYVGVRAIHHLASSTAFSLERVEVEGTARTTDAEIRAALEEFRGQNLLRIDLEEVAARCAEDRWVASASVKRMLPHALRVRVVERVPVALALLDGAVYVVDATGVPIGPAGPGLSFDLPVLTGVERTTGEARRAALARGARAIRRLAETSDGFLAQVSDLDLSRADRIEVATRVPGPRILLDPEEVERNVVSYLDLRRTLEEDAGPVASVDLRWRDRISVLPIEQEAESD